MDRRKESQEINSSLMVLKQCIRAKAKTNFELGTLNIETNHSNTKESKKKTKSKKSDYMPVRQSKLTRVLQDCFLPYHLLQMISNTL